MLRALVLVALSLFAHPALADRWYQVEVLVFARQHGDTAGLASNLSQPRYPSYAIDLRDPRSEDGADSDALTQGAWQLLGEDDRILRHMWGRMAGTGDYRKLFHESWRQPINSAQETTPIYLQGGRTLSNEDGAERIELSGTLHFSRSRYLHVDPQIWFAYPQDGEIHYAGLEQPRRLKRDDIFYFDHPLFGMLVRVTE